MEKSSQNGRSEERGRPDPSSHDRTKLPNHRRCRLLPFRPRPRVAGISPLPLARTRSPGTRDRRTRWLVPPRSARVSPPMPSSAAAASAAVALLLLPLIAAAGDGVSPRPTAVSSILWRVFPSCSASDKPLGPRGRHAGVVEGDDRALQKVTLVLQRTDDFVAILFYASWCPFSTIFRTDFQKLSSFFPAITHFSFEESRIKPRMLSRYGIRAFPTLFLMNSTVRVRYHGSRTMNSLAMFYQNVTGMNPVSVDATSLERMANTVSIIQNDKNTKKENSLFMWARSPERLLHQDTCLALASSFVLLRLLHVLIPKLNACVKQAWRMRVHELNRLFPELS